MTGIDTRLLIMEEQRMAVVKKTCRCMLNGSCGKKNCSMTCIILVSWVGERLTSSAYFSADEELKGQGSEHIQPKTKAGYVDHCVVLLGASVFNMLFSKKGRRTHACKVVQDISLRLVREHQVR